MLLQHNDCANHVTLYWYATLTPRHGIPTVAQLEADGWSRSNPHPWYPNTWFMKKAVNNETE